LSKQIGRYRIERKIGEGGMGDVYLGFDTERERLVAIKTIRRELLDHPKKLARFQREIDLQQQVKHPNVVQILDRGEHNGLQYIVLEFVEGQELAAVVPTGGMDIQQAVHITERVCLAMHDVHELGIIHRDMKPANVLLDGLGNPHIIDFGVAKSLSSEDDVKLTRDGGFVGTLEYASPEQAEGRLDDVDRRSDIFNLGAMLYKLLTGRTPFFDPKKTDPTELRMRIVRDHPIEPRRLRPEIPADLERIVLQALAKDREKRYPTAQAMASDLARFRAGERVRVAYSLKADKLSQWIQAQRYKILVTTLFLFCVCGFAAFYANKLHRDRQSQRDRADALIANTPLAADDVAAQVQARITAYRVTLAFPTHRAAIDLLLKTVPTTGDVPRLVGQAQEAMTRGDRNAASISLAQAYLLHAEEVGRLGWHFFDGHWLTTTEAQELGIIDSRLNRMPGKFHFGGAWYDEKAAEEQGFFVHDRKADRYLTAKWAQQHGWIHQNSQWMRPEDAMAAGLVYHDIPSDRFLSPREAAELGRVFHGGAWLTSDESEQRGLGMMLDRQWVNAEEAFLLGWRHEDRTKRWHHVSAGWLEGKVTLGPRIMAPERVTAIAWGQGTEQFVLGTASGKLLLYEKGAYNGPISEIQHGQGAELTPNQVAIRSLAFDHRDKALTAVDVRGTIGLYVIDGRRFGLRRVRSVGVEVVATRIVDADANFFEIAYRESDRLKIEHVPPILERARSITIGTRFDQAAWTANGYHILLRTLDGLQQWDLRATDQPVRNLRLPAPGERGARIAFVPSGVIAYALVERLWLLDGRDGRILSQHTLPGEITGLSFDANGELLVATFIPPDEGDRPNAPQGWLLKSGRSD
jgi:hypothetical protein